MIQILLVDDHPLMGEGTKLIIEQDKDMKVYFETSALKAVEMVKQQSFDVLLFDLQMPELDGFELTKKVLEIKPEAKVLIYTGYEIISHLDLFMECGAVGFVSKTANKFQILRAIRCALNDEIIIPFSFLKEVYYGTKPQEEVKRIKDTISLSERERNILKELTKGKTNKEIAQALFIGQRSLEYSLTNIFQKLGVQTRVEAVIKAKEIGLIEE